jgi:hypothetical protein
MAGRRRSTTSSVVSSSSVRDFDTLGLFEALDAQRVERGLSWRGVANEIWDMSADLNARRHDHPISPTTLTSMPKRRATSCQHALFMFRWLGRMPESFLSGGATRFGKALPSAGPDRRLRWDLARLYDALDARRREQQSTWAGLARELRCTSNQLTGIRIARYAIELNLAMKIVQWLERPAADFIYAAEW